MTNARDISESELQALEERFSAYVEGELDKDDRAALERELDSDPAVRAAYDEFRRTLSALSGLHKMSAPQAFPNEVTSAIHKRSAGRFFGRRAFGDRVPFELLALLALVLILFVALWARRSQTGALDAPDSSAADAPAPEVREVIPKP